MKKPLQSPQKLFARRAGETPIGLVTLIVAVVIIVPLAYGATSLPAVNPLGAGGVVQRGVDSVWSLGQTVLETLSDPQQLVAGLTGGSFQVPSGE